MYFNRKNAAQKNWRMIKKGKHFLFGCSLVFAVGATLVTPTVKADTVEAKAEARSTTEGNKPVAAEEDVTYAAPAVEVAPAAVAEEKVDKAVETTQNSKEEPVVVTEKAKEADGVQLPSLTVVADSSALTDEEKANIVEAVKGVNPTATDVQVQADGSVVVTFADGSSANLSATQTVKVAAPAETSATQPKSRSRRAAGQERAQDRSMEGKDIKFEYRSGKKVENGDPTQRAKIEYRQLDDYEVVNGKTVPTDPSGQGRPVLEWTVTFNEAQYDKAGAFWYFSIPKNVSDPYNVVTEYDGVYTTRTEWNNGDGNANESGKQFIDDGSKLEMRVKATTGASEYDKVPGLNGVMANSKKLYVLQTNIYSGIRKFTVRYRTVVEDPSQTISYLAGVQAAKNLAVNNWYAISGKYDKNLVSQVATPNVTPNLTKTSVNVPVQTVASTSSTLSGTGTPGATIKLYIDGQEQNIGNVTVDNNGNWTTGELPTALNNNQGDGTTIKPRQTVQVSQTVNGTESSRRTVPVSVGVTTVEPSSLTTNQAAVVAGQKEVTLKVPHDAGIAYMRYTNTAGQSVEIPVKRDNLSAAWTSQKPEAATVKSIEKGKFQDTIVLTMADKIAGTEVAAISNVMEGGFSSVADWQPRGVENQAPTIASAVEGNKKTVAQGAQLDLASLVTVADKEDDAQATLGDKVHAEVVSVNGNAATKTVDTNTQGTYTVKYKAVDSQGKESGEIEVTVVVNPARDNVAPTVEIPYSDPAPNKKEVYLYTGEEADVDITFNDDSGKIKSASLKKGGNIALNNIDGNPDKQDNEYGYTVTAINSETATPAKIKVTGQVSGIAAEKLPKTENDSLDLVTRFATATDTDGALINNTAVKTKKNGEVVGSYLTDPGAVTFVLKAQTKKYDIKTPSEADKVAVSDANNVTDKEFEKIKEKVKVEYSQNNPDARLADKKGQEVEDASKVVDKVEKDGNNVVVTYKDGSKDTKPLTDFARTNVAPTVEIPYSDPAPNKKEVYLYTGEEADVDITFNDDSGKIKSASLKKGGNIALNNIDGNPDKQDNEYGYTVTAINSETATPAKIKVTGQVSGIAAEKLPKTENDSLDLVTRFATATDTDGALINNTAVKTKKNGEVVGSYLTDPGAVTFVLKAQTKKYDIKTPSEADKVAVSDANNVTDKEFEKIKEKVKVEYSQNNPDARLADKKGQEVEDASKVVDKVEKDGNNVVVTYKDGSKDTKPLTDFARTNVAPTVEIPYSDPAPNKKEVYLYTGEEADVDITFNDDSGKIKSASLKKGGNIALNNIDGNPDKQDNEYGYTVTAINSETATPAKIKVTGQVSGIAAEKLPKTENDSLDLVTRFATATDTDGALINNTAVKTKKNGEVVGSYLTDPGAVTFVLKAQTKKYDIKTPSEADKVAVSDANNVTDKEFEKIKEKVKVEYSQNNPDARLADKKGQEVEDASKVVDKVEKDGNNVVVTYKDGSKDTKPLTDFARTNVAPTVEIPYSDPAPNKKEVYLYTGEEADVDITFNDDSGKIKSASLKKGGNIALNNIDGNPDKQDNEYGYTVTAINSETATPAKIKVTGQVSGIAAEKLPKTENDSLDLVTRFATATDTDGELINNTAVKTKKNGEVVGSYLTDPGAVTFVLKAQTKKYDIKTPSEADKVAVSDANNVTDKEFEKIKEKVKVEYSQNNPDARLADKKGQEVEDASKVVDKVEKDGNNVVVTYKDGSKDTKPLTDFARTNVAPTVEIPYSDPAPNKKEVYLYTGEEADVDITFNDDSGKIKSASLKKGGNIALNNIDGNPDKQDNEYGYTVTAINSETATPAKIKVTGQVSGIAAEKLPKTENDSLDLVTRFATATDTDGALINNTAVKTKKNGEVVGSYLTDPGAVTFVLKAQTKKYDIKTPSEADKVAVSDANNVTDKEFEKIKEKVKVEYSQNNPDARLADKKGQEVEDASKVVDKVEKDGNNVVVTYKDGSKDTKPLTDFARTNVAPTVEIPYSDPAPNKKEVYLYTGEEADVDITFNDDSGKIKSASLKKGGNIALNNIDGNPDKQDNEYGYTVTAINSETATPAKIKVTGQVSGIAAEKLPKTENDSLDLVTRFATATDTDGELINNTAVKTKKNGEVVGSYLTDPGAVTFVLKAQTKKYDIKTPSEADKVAVSDANNVTDKEFEKIKEKVKVEYSQNNPDARLADKKGQEVEDASKVVDKVEKEGNNVVVTYKDGSKDTKPLSEFVNVAPTVELPYSNQANKQIYVYTGENTDLTFKGTDEKEVKDLYLRGPGDVSWNNANKYGFTTGKVENGAVTGEGSVSEDKTSATIKMTGTTNLKAGQEWTSFIVSKDNNGELSNTDYRALDVDPNAKEKPGYVRFVVKNQTSKYDIATPAPADKVEVADPTKVTDAELDKIKEKLKLEYAQTNDDDNFADKKGKTVDAEDAKTKIKSVEKDNAGNLVVTYTDGSTDKKPLSDFVVKDTTAPAKPEVKTDLTGKAGTKDPVEVTAEPGSTVELFDKDGNSLGTAKADENGVARITPTKDIPAGDVTAKATDPSGNTSDASEPKVATDTTAPAKPEVKTDLTGKAGTKDPVEVTAEPGSTVELFDKDGNSLGTAKADENGVARITPTKDIPAGDVTAKATDPSGNTSDASEPKVATDTTAPAKPEVKTDLTGKAGTKDPVEVTAEPGSTVELFDKDGNSLGTAKADENGVARITPTKDIPAGDVTAKATDPSGNTSDASEPKVATDTTAPAKPEVKTDLTGKAGTKDPVEVTAEPGSTVELFDKDGNSLGTAKADENGVARITPTKAIPAGDVTAKATDPAGNTSDASEPKVATDTTAPAKPEVKTDLTGKAGTKDPVEVTAEPGSTVELFDKDGNSLGTAKADENGVARITPTKDIPAGDVTAKATDPSGNTSDASEPKEATAATPTTPTQPEITTDLTGKAGTKTPVEVTAEPGTKVELFDKDGNKIGEATAGADGKAKITPTVDIPEGNVTAKATKDGQTSEASAPKEATAATPTTPTQPEITTDLTGKAGTKTPVEVTAEPGTKVELFDKDGNKIGEATAGADGKAKITPTVDIPEGNVTAKATKDGQTSEASAPKEATAATPTTPTQPEITTDLTGKAGTKTPVEVTAEPGTKVELFDKDGNKIGEATAGADGKAKITPTVDIPEGNVTVVATKDGQTPEASDPVPATTAKDPATPAKDADGIKDPAKTPVKDPANLTDAEKAKVAEEVKKANPTAKDVEVGKDGTTTVTFPDGSKAEIPAAKTVEKAKDADGIKDPAKTPVKDPANLTDAEKAKVAEEVKKANPTAKDVEVGKDGTTTVTFPDGSKAEIPAAKTVEKAKDAEGVKDPEAKTPVKDPANLTDAEKAKVAEEVKKANPTAKDVEVGKDGTTTVTFPDGSKAEIPAAKTVEKAKDAEGVKDPEAKTPVKDPANLTDAEKAKVAEEVKKANPTAKDVEVGKDGTTTVTFPDGSKAEIPAAKTVKKSDDKAVKDPSVTPVTDPNNLTDAEKAKVAEEVKKANPTVTDVKVDKDGTTTVTYPDGTTAVIPADKTVKKSNDKVVTDPTVTPVVDPSNLTDAEKAKVADEVKKANPTAKDVEVSKDGTTTVAYPDGTTAVIPADKTVKKSDDKVVTDPTVTPVTDPSNLTDAEKAKVADEVKKANPTVTDVKVDKDGTTTVTYPDGTTAVIPADKTVKKSADKDVKDPSVTPVTDPSNLTDAEKAKVAEEVKKANPTVTDVKVEKDGTTTVTYPDGTTAVIPADKTVKKSADKAVKDPSVTPVADPSNLTDAEKGKVAEEVKKANPTVTDVKVDKDGTTTVTYPDGTTAVIPADKTVKKSDDKVVTDPTVTPVTDPSNLTDAEKAKVAEEVKKSNPTVTDVKVDKDGTTTVTYPDGTTAVIPADKTVKKSDDKVVTDPTVTPVTDPSNLTDAEKAKVAEEVKKSNPTVTDVKVDKDGTTTVTYPDGTTAVIPADKTVKKSDDKVVTDPTVTPVTDPSNLTDAEKAKVADEVKKSNPTVTDVKVEKDGTTTVTYPDGTTAVIPADKTVKESADKELKVPAVTPVTDPSNLTDAEKAKVADEVKKSNPTVTDVAVGNDGTATVTYPDGTTAVIPADKTVKESADKELNDPAVTPVTDPSNLTDAEKAKVAEEVKKSNPTVTDVKVDKDGTTTVTYPDGTTAVIPADKTVKESADKELKVPAVTPVTDPSNLTDAEKAKVADEVKKANPTVTDVTVGNDGTTTVTYPDGKTTVLSADKTVKKSDDKVIKDPVVTPVVNQSHLTDAEKTKVVDEVKKANPTLTDVTVGNDGTATVTYPDGTTAVIPSEKTVKESADKVIKDPAVTPVANPSALTDTEKAKVTDEIKKANPTASKVEVGTDGTATVTYPDGTTAVIPSDKTVKKSADKAVKDPTVTPVTDPSNLTDAEKGKVADEVKKSNPTVTDVKVEKDGTTTVTYPDGTTAVIPADKTVKKSADKAVKDPSVTPVADPSNLTDAEKAKVADEVKKSNPTVTDVKVDKDGTTTVTYPDGTTAVIPADKTVKKSDDKAVKDPSVTPVTDPSNLTDAEKGKVAEEVKKANPTVTDIKVDKDGTTTVTYPDGTTAVIPADKTVKKSDDKVVTDPTVTPVTDPSNLTDAEKAKVAEEVKKSNPTVTDVKVDKDGTTTVTYPDGTTAVIPADKTVKKSDDKVVTDPTVTPVTDPSNLTDAEKAKVAEEVKKSNPTVTDVKVDKDGTTTVTYPDGTTAVIPADKTVKKSDDKSVKDPSVTPVTDPSNLTDAEKAKVADEVKKSNPTVSKVEVGNDGTTTVTYPDGTTAVIPADKTVKKSSDKTVKDPSVTPVTDPSNLTDAEKGKVAEEVKKANPTVTDVKVEKDGTTTVTYPDGTTAVIPADKTVKKSSDKVVTNPTVTPVVDPSNLTDAEKAKVADKVKKANPTASKVEVGNDGTATVTFPDGSVAVLTPAMTVKSAYSNGVKNPSVTPVTDPSNLTDAEKAKVADEVKKANPTATDIKVNNDGSVVVTFADGSVAVIASEKAVKEATKESSSNPSAKKAGAKELPNTGTEQSNASVGLALLAAATGGLLFAKKRKEEE